MLDGPGSVSKTVSAERREKIFNFAQRKLDERNSQLFDLTRDRTMLE
jgi:hypothetical protein